MTITYELRSLGFRGRVLTGQADRENVACDFGNRVSRIPLAVLYPQDVEDVQVAVRYAGSRGIPLIARGHGHTQDGQSQVERGIVLLTESLRLADGKIVSIQDDASGGAIAVCSAGAKWADVLSASVLQGLRPAVLTGFQGATVGGTLSASGVWIGSHEFGRQIDNVLSLEAVDGLGRKIICGAGDSGDSGACFDAVLGGLGQFGIITQATIRLIRAEAFVHEATLRYRDVHSMLADVETISGEKSVCGIHGEIRRSSKDGGGFEYCVEVGWSSERPDPEGIGERFQNWRQRSASETPLGTSTFFNYAMKYTSHYPNDLNRGERLGYFPMWFNIASFSDVGKLEKLFEERPDILESLSSTDAVGIIPVRKVRESRGSLHPMTGRPNGSLLFGVTLFQTRASRTEAETLNKRNLELLKPLSSSYGATKYWLDTLPESREAWKQLLGASWQIVRENKARFDPEGVFAPLPHLF